MVATSDTMLSMVKIFSMEANALIGVTAGILVSYTMLDTLMLSMAYTLSIRNKSSGTSWIISKCTKLKE